MLPNYHHEKLTMYFLSRWTVLFHTSLWSSGSIPGSRHTLALAILSFVCTPATSLSLSAVRAFGELHARLWALGPGTLNHCATYTTQTL